MWGCGVFLRTMIAMMWNDLNDGLWFELGEKEEVGGKSGGCLGWWAGLRCWLFGVPLPFVRPGRPHPGPLPLSGRGDETARFAFLWVPAFAGMTGLAGNDGVVL